MTVDPTGLRPAPRAKPVGSPPHDSRSLIDPTGLRPAPRAKPVGSPPHDSRSLIEPTKGERTRKKLVGATAALLRRQGYHATGLSDIVAESGAPRGSLYFHFPGGKDELARAALLASSAEWRARIDAATAGARDIGEAIDATVTLLADDLESSGWDNGCPVAAVALESTSELVRETVREHFESWLDVVAERLAALGVAEAPARQLATVALSAFEGRSSSRASRAAGRR